MSKWGGPPAWGVSARPQRALAREPALGSNTVCRIARLLEAMVETDRMHLGVVKSELISFTVCAWQDSRPELLPSGLFGRIREILSTQPLQFCDLLNFFVERRKDSQSSNTRSFTSVVFHHCRLMLHSFRGTLAAVHPPPLAGDRAIQLFWGCTSASMRLIKPHIALN